MTYIGITGFKTYDEIHQAVQYFHGIPVGTFMLGITSSNKRLLDPTSSGKTSPPLVDVEKMVRIVPTYHIPMIHYFTSNRDQTAEEISALFDFINAPDHCGLQLNQLWPEPSQLRALKQERPQLLITMQLPKEVGKDQNEILKKLNAYRGLADYILIDPSSGTGSDVDIQFAAELMLGIKAQGFIPGVAGGFSAENVRDRIAKIKYLTRCHACKTSQFDFCIDAQGKLRETVNIKPVFPKNAPTLKQTKLSISLVKQYVENALQAFHGS